MQKFNLRFALKGIFSILFLLTIVACSDNSTSPSKSSEKQILSFKFEAFATPVVGVIDQNAKTISLKVPLGTDVTSLNPTITISDKATVSPASGTPQNFTNSVVYTVTAEDGSTANYTVTVSIDTTVIDPISLSGTLTENTTLKDLGLDIDYIIDGAVYIDGNALLTIEPGTTIAFASASSEFDVEENAGIKAVGTAAKPIIFTGPKNNQNKGSWRGITIYSNRADNEFGYVYIINAGGQNSNALELGYQAKLVMNNCKISNSGNNGIYLNSETSLTSFNNNLIENCEMNPISAANFNDITSINSSSNLVNNTYPFIDVRESTEIQTNLTINPATVPYHSPYIIVSKGTLTIADGVEIDFKMNGYLQITNAGYLNIDGSSKGILLTAETKEAGTWYGVEIQNKLSNVIKNCTIEFGGMGDEADLYAPDGKVSLTNVALNNSLNYGAYISDNSSITHSGVTFSNNVNGNVYNSATSEVLDTLP